MFLYTMAIEELIHNLILNKEVKGYDVNVTSKFTIKINGYADDIDGVFGKYESIGLFFREIEKWCEISGADKCG